MKVGVLLVLILVMATNNLAATQIVNTYMEVTNILEESNGSGINNNSDATPLPVSLIYFTGFFNNSEEVELKWTTASESNNNYFTLERSLDGLTFSAIGNILGNGTAPGVNKYQYTDRNDEIKGDSYHYRLSHTTLDGTKNNLEAILIKRESKPFKIWVYPTPVQQAKNIHIDFEGLQEGIYTIAILNTSGERIIQDQVNINYNFQSMEIETSNIPNGLYIIHIFSTANTFIQRIIVQ